MVGETIAALTKFIFTTLSLLGLSTSEWFTVAGGPNKDSVFQLAELKDGQIVGAGKVESGGISKPWLVTLDAKGEQIESKYWSEKGVFASVIATSDGGFLLTGHKQQSTADIWIIKFDQRRTVQWEKTYGGSGDDLGMTALQLTDGGFLIGADSYSADGLAKDHHGPTGGHRDYLILRVNAVGDLVWSRSYGGSNHEYLSQIAALSDQTFVAYGRTESSDGDVHGFRGEYDGWAVRFNSDGEIIWERPLGGSMWDWGSNAVATEDGGVVLTGYFFSWDGDGAGNKGDYDYSAIKLNAQGKREWSRMFGGSHDDFAQGAAKLPDGSILISGGTVSNDGDVTENRGNFDLWLIRISPGSELLSSRTYGGSAYDISSPGGSDYYVSAPGGSLITTRDGGVLIAGASKSGDGDVGRSFGKTDAWILKLAKEEWLGEKFAKRGQRHSLHPPLKQKSRPDPQSSPPLLWSKVLGGHGKESPLDSPQALVDDGEEGFTFLSTADDGVWIANVTKDGNLRWQSKYFGPRKGPTSAAAIARKRHGKGYLFTAAQAGDLLAISTDSRGKVLWQKTFGGSASELASTVISTSDGGFVIGGSSYSKDRDVKDHIGGYDFWLVKLDARGTKLWSRSVGGLSNDFLIQAIELPGGDLALIGRTESTSGMAKGNHGMYDYLAARLDSSGRVKWTKTYGGIDWEWGNSVTATKDGGLLLGGYSYTFDDFELGDIKCNHGEFDYWVVKTTAEGQIEWQQCFGGANYDLAYGMIELKDGNFALVGGTASHDGDVTDNHGGWDAWVVKFDKHGQKLWQKTVGTADYEVGYAIAEGDDGSLVILGESDAKDREDILLFKFAPD